MRPPSLLWMLPGIAESWPSQAKKVRLSAADMLRLTASSERPVQVKEENRVADIVRRLLAREDQATDRVHRIGQRRAVQVFKLVSEGTLDDRSALRVLERSLDIYHFKEVTAEALEEPLRSGFEIAVSAIREDLADIPNEVLVRVLSVIYFVAKRRARGGRDYFDIIHQYVGTRVGPGMRILGV